MRKVVPSEVKAVIEKILPPVRQLIPNNHLHMDYAAPLEGLLDLVQQIPSELITLGKDDYAAFVQSIATIRFAVEIWKSGEHNRPLGGVRNYDRHAVRLLYDCICKCPDEAALPGTTWLEFIDHKALRNSVRTDLSAAHVDYANGEWKSCVVMCGAVMEALLLWALLKFSEEQAENAVANDIPERAQLERWHLPQYVDTARRLAIIDADTVTQATLSNNFRNLIHPGRQLRLQQTCTKGTALSALGGAERVAEAIANWVAQIENGR